MDQHSRKSTSGTRSSFTWRIFLLLIFVILASILSFHVVQADDDILAELLREEAEQDEYHEQMEAEARAQQHGGGGSGGGEGSEEGEDKYDRPPPGMDGSSGGGMPGGGANKKKKMPGAGGGGGGFDSLEDELRKKEEAAAKARAQAEEEAAAELAERHRLEREAAFEAEVARMNAEQRKKAMKQKKIDASIVNKILKAAAAKPEPKHYVVLGIRNWDIHIGPWHLLKVDTKDIKRAYRSLSRKVHPDKNRDGRAEEAFHALEASAAILSDPDKKRSYDRRVAARRKKRNAKITGVTMEVLDVGKRNVGRVLGTVKRVLGPFSTPILVLGALVI